MLSKIHKPAAAIGFLCIATFFSATVLSELFGSHETVAAIKKLILFPGLLILIPALAATGASGFKLAKNRKGRLLEQKKKRMPFIAANGLLILVPCAFILSSWASQGKFDTSFYAVQALELMAGALNLSLMYRNMKDGLKLAGAEKVRSKHRHD